ncbi:MAG: tRNA dihydrouridine synthase DusB [Candidatus Margulisbacteria bacterium]|nr:tRNA dihydrouridine synthase DusB [Candidatus Margulisiibacteriota bacterium]
MVKIGPVEIPTNIFLSPLAGVSDLSFRLISREHGAKFCFYEMVDSNSLVHGSGKDKDILKTHPKDSPIAAQILGGDQDKTLKAAEILREKVEPAFIDLNAACPAKKVIKKQAGAHLLRDLPRLEAIIKSLSSRLNLPVTVKIRIGYDQLDFKALVELAKVCQGSGAAALFVHGRTRKQMYAGEVNYEAIKLVKQTVNIPVFGSGDILSAQLAGKMLDLTVCDGVFVARGAIGYPWIFKEIEDYFKTGKIPPAVTFAQKKKVLKQHLLYMQKYKESRLTKIIGLMRRITLSYLKSLPEAKRLRQKITSTKTHAELLDVIESIKS